MVTEQFGNLRCCIPETEEAIHPVGSHEEKAKQGDDHLHKQRSLKRCKSYLHSKETDGCWKISLEEILGSGRLQQDLPDGRGRQGVEVENKRDGNPEVHTFPSNYLMGWSCERTGRKVARATPFDKKLRTVDDRLPMESVLQMSQH